MDCDIKQSHSGIVLATEVGVKPFWKALAGRATFDSNTPSKLPRISALHWLGSILAFHSCKPTQPTPPRRVDRHDPKTAAKQSAICPDGPIRLI